jgi:hypothetical protein
MANHSSALELKKCTAENGTSGRKDDPAVSAKEAELMFLDRLLRVFN